MIELRENTDLTAWGSARDASRIPWELQDAVELWARQNRGTHGRVTWSHAMNCAVVELDLKPDDPRLKAYQDGRLRHKPTEIVPLQRREGSHLVGIPLGEVGVDYVIALLDKGNLWSGRGEYTGLLSAVRAAEDHNQRLEEQMQGAMVENARLRAREDWRFYKGDPQVAVPADLEE